MTGRDLIIYILKNGLEDEPIYKDGRFVGMLTIDEAAVKKQVGPATIQSWIDLGFMSGIAVKPGIFVPADQL